MITEFFQDAGINIFIWLLSMMPSFNDVEGVVVTAGTFIVPLMLGAGSLATWLPWTTVLLCMGIVFPLYVGTMAFRIFRVILGHLPLIGGNG